jgi:hypothetical protein
MTEQKVYVLAKDGPDAPKGQKYYRNKWTTRYQPKDSEGHVIPYWADYSEKFVENNSTWFKPLEDDEISKAKELLLKAGYRLADPNGRTSYMVTYPPEPDLIPADNIHIKNEGWYRLNFEDGTDAVPILGGELRQLLDSGTKYTEVDLRMAFREGIKWAQDYEPLVGDYAGPTFEKFVTSLKNRGNSKTETVKADAWIPGQDPRSIGVKYEGISGCGG